jgi:hypothetical protein
MFNLQTLKDNNNRLNLLFFLYLLPTFFECFFKWSNPFTSEGFTYAPHWFSILKILMQCLLLGAFLYPICIKITTRKICICFCLILCFVDLIFYKYTHDLIDPNVVATKSLMVFIVFVGVLSILKTKYILQERTIRFIFNIFLVGFILQILAYYFLDINPSHSQAGFLLPRFNGLTNDSLATGLIIPLFIPILINNKTRVIEVLILISMSILTGSLYSLFITLFLLFFYLLYKKLFSLMFFIFLATVFFSIIFYQEISYILSYKIHSILVHLDYFIKLFSNNQTNCEEVFCESFFAQTKSISWISTLLFYICLGYMIRKLIIFGKEPTNKVVIHSILFLGLSILIASLFHPVIIIPFAINLFFIAFLMLSNAHTNSLNNLKVMS